MNLSSISKNGKSLENADDSLNQDREVVPGAVKKDRKIVHEAVKENDDALKYADESLKKEQDFLSIISQTKN